MGSLFEISRVPPKIIENMEKTGAGGGKLMLFSKNREKIEAKGGKLKRKGRIKGKPR